MTQPRPFAHLHCHTHYSLLDGASKIPEYVRKVKECGMDACAITDHGNLSGAIEFYNACRDNDVNPIIGYEAYIAPTSRKDKSATRMKEAQSHLTLLAMNVTGFQNLIRLSSIAYTEGYHYKPRIDREILAEMNEGLICLSGCASSDISKAILKEDFDAAKDLSHWFEKTFGDRFYFEIQNGGLEIQRLCTEGTVDLARDMGVPLVATNDAHYLNREDAAAHDVLLCVNTHAFRSDANRMRFDADEFYVRTQEEMYAAFEGFEDAVAMSQEIADRCDIQIDFEAKHYPVFVPPDEKTDTEYLREICIEGMHDRYKPDELTDAHWERLDYELQVIDRMGYSSYFLIVWDFVNFSFQHKIPCQARGSAVGSIVAYVLRFSNVCPIEYDLLFERFLDPSRAEPPDIDIDFCKDRRQLVIDYTKEKYGEANVAQIGTYGTLKAKAAIRDVSRALSVPLKRADEVARMVPDTLGITLAQALKDSPELNEAYQSDPMITEMIDIAMQLEGLAKSAGTHAAGVVVADQPLNQFVPLQTIANKANSDAVTQWDGPTVEMVGLLKMDFLGLRNLTILDKAVENVRKHRGVEIDPLELPLDDVETFKLLQRGETKGIFQLESGGMRDLLQKMRPDKFEDIIATSALYRPGPLEGGMVMKYVNVKNGLEEPDKVHPIVDAILEETYSVMVYQEQVMRILNQLGGIELPKAYRCIKAISKKKLKIIAAFKEEYLAGAQERGVDVALAERLFELIEKFAGYGFNKCVVASTEILDASTGERTTVGDLFHKRRPFTIHALNDSGALVPRRVTDVVWNGRKRVFRLTTAQGREITATGNHPFRTFDGWTNLEDLASGDLIASPRVLAIGKPQARPEHEIVTLGHLIAEGNTCHPTCLYFYSNSTAQVADFVEHAASFSDTVARVDRRSDGVRHEVCLSTGGDFRFGPSQRVASEAGSTIVAETVRRSGAFRWADELGILGKTATEKRLPEFCFSLPDEQVAHLLGRLWTGDGFLGSPKQMPFYATSSAGLAHDVQTLLTRLGIVSGVHQKVMRYSYRGERCEKVGYTVHLVGSESRWRFLEWVTPHVVGRDEQIAELRNSLGEEADRSSVDVVPVDVRHVVDEERKRIGLTWRQLESESGLSMRGFTSPHPSKRGFRRATILKLAEFFDSQTLREIARSDVFWDRIVSIEPVGVEDTYDLTVEEDHNFVADGLIVHNSHSTAYGAVAYQTAYLKAHYPVEFMAALLSCNMESTDRIFETIDDCRRMKIDVLPPSINESGTEFTVAGPQILFGLGAIKGVGENVLDAIVAEREANGPYKSLFDITERVDPKLVTKGVLEILVRAGALDEFGPHRAQHSLVVERAVQSAVTRQKDKARGQKNLFGGGDEEEADDATEEVVSLPDTPPWTHSQKLSYEREVLGFYLTSHPLTEFASRIEPLATHRVHMFPQMDDRAEVRLGGMISSIKIAQTKKPNRNGHTKYANFDLEDATGVVRCIMWADEYARQAELIEQEAMRVVRGRLDTSRREPNVIVDKLFTIDEAEKEFTTQLAIKFQNGLHSEGDMRRVRDVLNRHPGRTEVVLVVVTHDKQREGVEHKYLLKTPQDMTVSINPEMRSELFAALGEDCVRFIAPKRNGRNGHA